MAYGKRKRKGKDKRTLQIIHSMRRYTQRYNKELKSVSEYLHLVNLSFDEGEVVLQQTARLEVRKFEYDNEVIYCVTDANRRTIVTFLTNIQIKELVTGDYTFRTESHEITTLDGSSFAS